MAKVHISDLPEKYQEIYREMMMPVDTNISLDSVILSEENKNSIKSFIKEIEYKDKLRDYGLKPMNRLLFYGASGTGKTYLAKALSNHLGYTMLYVDIAKSLSEGNVSKNVANIFELADRVGDCILFLDECDSVAFNRDSSSSEGGNVRRATNSIFQHLDQMSDDNIFISATNMLHRLDAAFERRFNLKLMFKRPDIAIDDAIRHFAYNKFTLVDDTDPYVKELVQKRSQQYVKLSYYELQIIVERAMKNAVLNDRIELYMSEVYAMLAEAMNFKIKFGTAKDENKIFNNNETYDPTLNKNIKE